LAPSEDLHLETRQVHTARGVYRTSLAILCPPGVRPRVSFRVLDTVWPNPGADPQLPVDESAVGHGSDEEVK
jgi:hypothetical protein